MTPNLSGPAPEAVREAARALARAKNPIVITSSLGRSPESVPALVTLAETLNLPVFSGGNFMNFPMNHRLMQQGVQAAAQFPEADLLLIIEADVPWSPSSGRKPREDARIISIGEDPLFSNYPVRSFRSDLSLAGSTRLSLNALIEALKNEQLDRGAIDARGKRWSEEHDKAKAASRERAQADSTKKPLEKAWVAACLEKFREEDTIVVNELGLDTTQFEFTKPGTFFGAPTVGILGWGLGAALGAKLASRDSTVIACLGDGSYMFGVPTAGHWISRKYNLPVLYIVWNNAQWGAVASATRGVYPDGWSVRTENFPFSDLSPSLDFEMICQSAGGYGERVEDPADVPAAIERALHAVKVEKRQALLNIVAAPR
jgi:acetolactate synthase-1/2/3 large subunit